MSSQRRKVLWTRSPAIPPGPAVHVVVVRVGPASFVVPRGALAAPAVAAVPLRPPHHTDWWIIAAATGVCPLGSLVKKVEGLCGVSERTLLSV